MSSPSSNSGYFYAVTAYSGTHLRRNLPIDPRLSEGNERTLFYLVDQQPDPSWKLPGPVIAEKDFDPRIMEAGKKHLGEWSFLLNEYYTPFAKYPFYFLSSRFYEKNQRLSVSLNSIAELLFAGLDRYGWGYLPSYDRPPGYVDLLGYSRGTPLGIRKSGADLVKSILGIDPVFEARWFSDFFCNYIGFRSRQELIQYVEFYLPLIRHFLDDDWNLIRDPYEYVRPLAVYRNEKPLTFLIEMASHLFFTRNQIPFFGAHTEGLFEINEHAVGIEHAEDFAVSGLALESWAQQLLHVSQFDLAEQQLRKAMKRSPERPNSYVLLANSWLRQLDFSKARAVINEGSERHPILKGLLAQIDKMEIDARG
jgi:hypothetical protein